MNILIAVEELRFGGAQIFSLRLAQALYETGHRVWLYTSYGNLTEVELVRRLAPDVPVVEHQPIISALDKFIQRAEGWLERRGYHSVLRRRMLSAQLKSVLRKNQIDVVSSNTFKSDELMANVLEAGFPRVPLIITMHGDYEQFWDFYQAGGGHVLPNYPVRLARTLARTNAIAYLANQNLRVLAPAIVPAAITDHLTRRRIYNGLEGRYSAERAKFSRVALGIEPSAFVVGMVARGVPEKGWIPLLTAYGKLRDDPAIANRPVHLVLVGSSSFLDELKQQYVHDAHVHFLGFVNNPIDCVPTFDVGVLASSLKESLPNSIAECLFAGRPVVSTDVGEIRNMLCPEVEPQSVKNSGASEKAGFLIDFPLTGSDADAEQLFSALRRYVMEPGLLSRHQRLARLAYRKFSMARCITAYVELYETSKIELAKGDLTP